MGRGIAVVVVVVSVLFLGIWTVNYPDYERKALSCAFTPEGAKAYAAACEVAHVMGQPISLVETWASAHPYDVDLDAGNHAGVCQCAARAGRAVLERGVEREVARLE